MPLAEMKRTTSRVVRENVIEIGPQRLEFYRDRRIAEGATSTVYFGRQVSAGGRPVAIKVYDNLPPDPEDRARFRLRKEAEIRALAAIKNPRIIAIIDSGTISDGPLAGLDYIVMEYVGGGSLQFRMDELLQRGELMDPSLIADILGEVGKALQDLEAHKIVHRDVKPANILIDSDGAIKLADFGLSRIDGVTPGLTRQGIPIGTPTYMSPEQARGERCDIRSDLWSLGAVAHYLATSHYTHGEPEGASSKGGDDFTTILHANSDEDSQPPRIEDSTPGFPEALASVIHRMLDKDPAGRFQTVGEFLDALAAAVREIKSGATTATATDPLQKLLGTTLGSYRIEMLLGSGANGAVFKAIDEKLGRPVALKFLLQTRDPESQKRFEREMQNAAKLDHPNAVGVYAAGSHEGMPWIAMQYVDGQTSRRVMETHKTLPLRLALAIVRQALLGCHAAHEIGLIHRDVKPENILVIGSDQEVLDPERIRVKVTDFGLLRSIDNREPRITENGVFYGTPEYASPEQARAEELDPRADQYSLGVCLYEMLSGCLPYVVPNPAPLAWLTTIGDPKVVPVALSLQYPDVPREVESLVHKMISKRREGRFEDALEAVRAIDTLLEKLASGTLAPPRPRRRVAWVAAASAAAVLALVAANLVWNPLGKKGSTQPLPHASINEKNNGTGTEKIRESKEPEKTERGDRKVETHTEEKKEPEKSEPKPKLIPLTDRISNYPMTEADHAFLGALLALASDRRAALGARSYASFSSGIDDLGPTSEYGSWHTTAARELVDSASSVVVLRLKEISTIGRKVTLTRNGKGSVTGEVKDANDTSVTIASDGGLVRVLFSDLAPADFLQEGLPTKAVLAFTALSVSPVRALEEIVRDLDTCALWIPVVVRLAREEAIAHARRGEFPQAQELFGRIAEGQPAISPLYPDLDQSDFAAIRKEKDAIALLLADRYSDVVADHADTTAYAPASKKLLEEMGVRFLKEKDLARKLIEIDPVIDKMLEEERKKHPQKFLDMVGGIEWTSWTLQPPDPSRKIWDREPRGEVAGRVSPAYVILRDTQSVRLLNRREAVAGAEHGIVLCYRLLPAMEDSHFRFTLISSDDTSLYLRVTGTTIELYRPVFEKDLPDKLLVRGRVFEAPEDKDAWRTLTLLPVPAAGGGALLVYADGDPEPVLRVALKDARISALPSIGVCRGELHIRNMIANLE